MNVWLRCSAHKAKRQARIQAAPLIGPSAARDTGPRLEICVHLKEAA